MYFNSNTLKEFSGHRVNDMVKFITSGWGCVRKNDLLSLFELTKLDYQNFLRTMKFNGYMIKEIDDYIYYEVYRGYKPTSKYLNSLSALISIARKNRQKEIMITSSVYNDLFSLMMHMSNTETNEVRTYYTIDSQALSFPLYVLGDIIKEEIYNGFQKDNRLILIVYSEDDIEHIDVPCLLYFALLRRRNNESYFEFYDNAQLIEE